MTMSPPGLGQKTRRRNMWQSSCGWAATCSAPLPTFARSRPRFEPRAAAHGHPYTPLSLTQQSNPLLSSPPSSSSHVHAGRDHAGGSKQGKNHGHSAAPPQRPQGLGATAGCLAAGCYGPLEYGPCPLAHRVTTSGRRLVRQLTDGQPALGLRASTRPWTTHSAPGRPSSRPVR